jgi:hypothetical protein
MKETVAPDGDLQIGIKNGSGGGLRRGGTAYTECQAFYPVVRMGSHHPPHPQDSVAPPPPFSDPILTMGQTLWYSRKGNILI